MVVGTVNFSEKSLLEEKAIAYSENSEDFAARSDIRRSEYNGFYGLPKGKELDRAYMQMTSNINKHPEMKSKIEKAYKKRIKNINQAWKSGQKQVPALVKLLNLTR